jgi:flagellar hook-associated protein 1 FlgK
VSGKSGIPAALSSLYGAFSTWANSPNDATARQSVLTQASNVAAAFQTTSVNIGQLTQSAGQETSSLVDQVNQLAGQLASYNNQISSSGQLDPGTDAAVNSTLEKLSQIASVVTIQQPNGTFNVLLGGQTELVDGSTVNKLTAAVYVPTRTSIASGSPVSVPVSITAGVNDTLNLKVGGATIPTITLSPADTSATQVAADINQQLQTAGVNATASVDTSGRLVIASGGLGGAASVQVLPGDGNTTLGLSVGGPPNVRLTDSFGSDVTTQVTGGSLAAAIQQQNQVLPALQGDFSQTGSLNQLAKGFADRVNSILGVPLFTYDQTNATNAAASLQFNSSITSSQLPSAQVVSLTGTSVTTPFAITTGTNDSIQLSVNGGTSQSFVLSPSDTTMTDVASDLNTQFAALGIGAQASVDSGTGGLKIATTNTNSGSIAISGGNALTTLGLTIPTATYQDNSSQIALHLASLANPTNSADEINGQSFTGFFGNIAASVGTQLASAQSNQGTQQDVLTQAQSLRQQASGVDLNTEATRVLELQSSYQAASKLITVIDSMAQSVLAIIPQSA